MPEARGDIREIIGEPVFIPLFKLFLAYGPVFKLSFGPKTFVIVSDPALAKQAGSHGNAALRKRPACLIPCTLVVASAVAGRRQMLRLRGGCLLGRYLWTSMLSSATL